MKHKDKIEIRKILQGNKNYLSFNTKELNNKYELYKELYSKVKSKLNEISFTETNSKINIIKQNQFLSIKKLYNNILNEINEHIKIIKNIINE